MPAPNPADEMWPDDRPPDTWARHVSHAMGALATHWRSYQVQIWYDAQLSDFTTAFGI